MERLKCAMLAIRENREVAGDVLIEGFRREGFARALGQWVADAMDGVIVLPEDF